MTPLSARRSLEAEVDVQRQAMAAGRPFWRATDLLRRKLWALRSEYLARGRRGFPYDTCLWEREGPEIVFEAWLVEHGNRPRPAHSCERCPDPSC